MSKGEAFILLQKQKRISIMLSKRESEAVKIATNNLAQDIKRVCDCEVIIQNIEDEVSDTEGTRIFITTLDGVGDENDFPTECKPDTGLLLDQDGKKRWEAYLHQVIENVLYIVGTDRRGTIFGIYELSEQMGVSPWYFWADVPPKRKEIFTLPYNYSKVDWPSVPYRGIFLNDEEELDAWSKLHTKDNTIGPETYGYIFELILRLKGNYIWPAMHVNYFNENTENGRLANEMGIVVGTSHCDMLLRSNQNEWFPWLLQKGYGDIKYDYSISDRNREIIQEYWTESVEMNKDYEACYTVGMRGIHDYGFSTEKIDQNHSLTPEEKQKSKVKLLETVIEDQKQILKNVLGKEEENTMKLFIPYKEVLALYNEGLNVPDDVTLMWVDDNFGYMRRYPNAVERKRQGGNGLYYHASYWGAPGMSYLFINSIPLAHTANELKKCYESGIQKLWVLNVGALKPLEQDMEFFLRYGWDIGKEGDHNIDASTFTERWINSNFTGKFGAEAADIYNQFAQLTNVCKLEHMQSDKFSQTSYGNEALRRLGGLKDVYDRANAIYHKLPKEEQDAFFELFLMKIQASYYINASFYYADRSRLSYARGAMQSADHYLALSRRMDDEKRRIIDYYNNKVQDGKWNGILTPESFSPPPTVLYPAGKPALVILDSVLGCTVPDGEIEFSAYGETKKVIELFNKGCGEIAFQIHKPKWLDVSHEEGVVRTDKKIILSICKKDEHNVLTNGEVGCVIVTGEKGERYEIPVKVLKRPVLPINEGKKYFVEADGYVSMPADQYEQVTHTSKEGWRVVPHIGRGWGNAVESFSLDQQPYHETVKNAPSLQYPFFLQSEGAFILEVYRFLTLNATGQVRFAISIDENEPVVFESCITDEWIGGWDKAVMDNGEKLYIRLPYLQSGLHNLKVHMIDQYVTLTKLVIYTKPMKNSNLGPCESLRYSGDSQSETGEYPTIGCDLRHEVELQDVEAVEKSIDSMSTDKPPLLPMLYADPSFWRINRLYVKSDEKAQNHVEKVKYKKDEKGRKNIFEEFGQGIFIAHAGKIAIEAEYALENSQYSYLTHSVPDEKVCWTHTQAETDGGAGLAMMIEERELYWENAAQAPGMHYRIQVEESGKYYIWLLVKFEDHKTDACVLALDGNIQDGKKQFSRGNLFTYSMKQRWNWQAISEMEISAGIHTFSILGKKSGLRIDRIYITKGDEWPPIDEAWEVSQRKLEE